MQITKDRKINGDSAKWKNYQSVLISTTCDPCDKRHGKIVSANDWLAELTVKLHLWCYCTLVAMRTKQVGTATSMGKNGVDYSLFYNKTLPSYYITKEEAKSNGWISNEGNLSESCPGKMIGGNIFKNKKGKLPDVLNRIWYEADIDYQSGYRNTYRILYSNDGLIFVTYDHYQTFYEVTK